MEQLHTSGWPLLVVGGFLLAGYLAHTVGQRAHVPRVTLLLLIGLAAGPHGLHLVPETLSQWFPTASQLALSIVGFLLGEQFLGPTLRRTGRLVLTIAAAETVLTALVVLVTLLLMGAPTMLAFALSGVSAATDPAATFDVVRESGAEGPVSDVALAVVAIDDVFGILVFSLVLTVAEVVTSGAASSGAMFDAAWEILGAILVGTVVGFPMAWLTGRIRQGELMVIEGLGFVWLCGGIASVVGASYLLACTVAGTIVANRARHHTRPFHAIRGVSQPFMITFFLLAGFAFDPGTLQTLGAVGAAYVLSRSVGKITGGTFGALIAGAPRTVKRHIGTCLLPQAGVAIGLGLLAAERMPKYGPGLLSLLVGTTVLFELFGPLATRGSLARAGETRNARERAA